MLVRKTESIIPLEEPPVSLGPFLILDCFLVLINPDTIALQKLVSLIRFLFKYHVLNTMY